MNSSDRSKGLCDENCRFDNFIKKHYSARYFYTWILSIIEIPVVLLTLFAMCSLIKSRRNAASVYVIHLVLSDLSQIVLMLLSTELKSFKLWCGYYYCLIVGLYFMGCIAFERYLLVSHPIWYRSHHSVKFSCYFSLIIWIVPLIFANIENHTLYFTNLTQCIAFFLPYPIILLCFVGTWRSLSNSISLTSLKQKLVLGGLFLVLINYTFLILPFSVVNLLQTVISFKQSTESQVYKVELFVDCLLYLNPLIDCLLYLFMRNDFHDVIKFLYCCCKSDRHQIPTQHTTSSNTQHHDVQ